MCSAKCSNVVEQFASASLSIPTQPVGSFSFNEEGLQLNINDAMLIFEMDKSLKEDLDINRLFAAYNVL